MPNLHMTSVSTYLGTQLGAWIVPTDFDEVAALSWAALQPGAPSALLFHHGWFGMGYRMRGASEHAAVFPQYFVNEPATSHEDRYQQDHHAFGFLSAACAAVDCIVYAVHAAALGLSGVTITAEELKKTRDQMVARVVGVQRLQRVGFILQTELQRPEKDSMFTLRDVFIHRGRATRNHFVGGPNHGKTMIPGNPKDVPTAWLPSQEWGSECLDPYLFWLCPLISNVTAELKAALT